MCSSDLDALHLLLEHGGHEGFDDSVRATDAQASQTAPQLGDDGVARLEAVLPVVRSDERRSVFERPRRARSPGLDVDPMAPAAEVHGDGACWCTRRPPDPVAPETHGGVAGASAQWAEGEAEVDGGCGGDDAYRYSHAGA